MASPDRCWTAATSANPPTGSSSRSSARYPCGAVPATPSRYLDESMYSSAGYQAEWRQLVPPVEGGEQSRGKQDQDRAGGEQQGRCVVVPSTALSTGPSAGSSPDPAGDQPAQGQHQAGREHRPGQVDPPS